MRLLREARLLGLPHAGRTGGLGCRLASRRHGVLGQACGVSGALATLEAEAWGLLLG